MARMIKYDDDTSVQGGFKGHVVDLGHDNSTYVYDENDDEDEEGW